MQLPPQNQDIPQEEARQKPGFPPLARLGLGIGILVTGYVLLRLGGGFPPLSWKLLYATFVGRGAPAPNPDLVIIQSIILLVGWLLLLLVAIQIVRPGRRTPAVPEEELEALAAQEALRIQSFQHPGDLSARQQWSVPSAEDLQREQERLRVQTPAPPYTTNVAERHQDVPAIGAAPLAQAQERVSSFGSVPFERTAQQQLEAGQAYLSQAAAPSTPQERGKEQDVPSNTLVVSEQEVERMRAAAQAKASEHPQAAVHTAHVALTESPALTVAASLSQAERPHGAPPLFEEAAPSALEQLAGKTSLPKLASLFSNSSRDPSPPGTLRISLSQYIPQQGEEWFDMVGWAIGHPGRVQARDPLEDFLLVTAGLRTKRTPPTPFAIFVLADGIAHEGLARTTSRIVARATLEAALSILWKAEALDQDAIKELMTNSVQYGNAVLHQLNQQHEVAKIATLTLVLVLGPTAYFANVGDNRAYFYRHGEGLVQISYDHSHVEPLLEQNKTTPAEVFSQPKEKQVYRVLGSQASVNVDVFALALHAGDLLILCSDGLWKVVRKAPFQQIVEQLVHPSVAAPQLVCPALLQAALAGGGGDHVSILAVQTQARIPEQTTSL
jgi:protein phosphatase